jgi:carboxymethylenebutenolidase
MSDVRLAGIEWRVLRPCSCLRYLSSLPPMRPKEKAMRTIALFSFFAVLVGCSAQSGDETCSAPDGASMGRRDATDATRSHDGGRATPDTGARDTGARDAGQDIGDGSLDADNPSGCAVNGSIVSYLTMTTTNLSDPRCGPPSGGMCTIDLKGFLYIPGGAVTPLPAIVYNHGSEPLPGPKCSIADYFVPKGYVVFVPHRRGQGLSTGLYVGDYDAGPTIDYLEEEVEDVTDAWDYVLALKTSSGGPVADAKRMALMGHSFGGIMTLLTNATSLGQVAAVDLCGDSESWNTPQNMPYNVPALDTAVDDAKSPIFFLQPENDVATDPTIDFSNRAGVDKQQFQATIYPPVPDAATPEIAHELFESDPAEVALWGTGALDFLHRYGM